MPTMIQLRHVPDDLHRKLKARAAMEGLSLSDYLIREVRQIAEKPTMSEMMERLARLTPVHLKTPPAEMVRGLRDRRVPHSAVGADGGAARDRRRRARARTSLPRGGDAACAPPSGPGDCPRVTPLLPDRRTAETGDALGHSVAPGEHAARARRLDRRVGRVPEQGRTIKLEGIGHSINESGWSSAGDAGLQRIPMHQVR